MIQNLKIDIIYYNTPSDFEFEFNLGGCCHSRVLNGKSNTPKEMITNLSKAVARSRVIILIGKLKESDGLFSLISKAIGAELSNVDANEYNIANGTDTTIISGSLPLVSSDGLLSGCIIESGPQSIIILPEEKAIRKDIAENLVFQYITAVGRTPETESVATSDSSAEAEDVLEETPVSTATEEPIIEIPADNSNEITESIAETTPVAEEIPQFVSEITEIMNNESDITDADSVVAPAKFTDENDIVFDVQEDSFIIPNDKDNKFNNDDLIIEPDESNDFISNEEFFDIYAEEKADIEMDNNFVFEDSKKQKKEDFKPTEKTSARSNNKGSNTLIWIILGLMFIVAAILTYMLVLTPIKEGIGIGEYIRQVFNL